MRCLSVLDLVILFYLFIFFLGREAQKVREWGVNTLKTSIFLHPLKVVGSGKIEVFKDLTGPFADLLSFAAKEKNKQIK